jgi:hypothetical protein
MCLESNRADLFWEKVDKRGPVIRQELGHCWQWTASVDRRGYGQVSRYVDGKAKHYRAHRYGWMLVNGALGSDQHLLHSCDNPRCVNPNHLRIGTPRENIRDAIERKRFLKRRALLTPEQVREIKESRETQRVLAARYGVNPSSISDIKTGVTWKDVI